MMENPVPGFVRSFVFLPFCCCCFLYLCLFLPLFCGDSLETTGFLAGLAAESVRPAAGAGAVESALGAGDGMAAA